MADVKINLSSLGKDVLVSVSDDGDLKENFNAAAAFVHGLEARGQICDLEKGVNPERATHEVVREKGVYRLKRFRFA
jgi:hypothetical protein